MKMTPTPRSKQSEPPGPILIAGAGGMLGFDLAAVFRKLPGGTGLIVLDRAGLDIGDASAVNAAFERHRPALVLNAAGYTNVDGAEKERDAAFRANVTGPANLARACARFGAKLVHYSTDQVFDGKGKAPSLETDAPSPLNHYARTKLLGEEEALKAPGAVVLRVQWLYGVKKNRFLPLRERAEFTPFADQFGSPTWSWEVAETTVDLARGNAEGIFHFAYDDYASWADVFAFVKAELKLPVKLIPKRTDEVHLPAERPLFSVMSNRKLAAFLGRDGMGSWKEPLRRFLGP